MDSMYAKSHLIFSIAEAHLMTYAQNPSDKSKQMLFFE